jgi:hypothetical protein
VAERRLQRPGADPVAHRSAKASTGMEKLRHTAPEKDRTMRLEAAAAPRWWP